MIREVLQLSDLSAMAPDDAAAMWIARRADGVALDDEPGFREWLEADEANRTAWEDAEAAWRCFDESDDDELLQEMRRAALAASPEPSWRWKPVAAMAASLALVASASLYLLNSGVSPPASVVPQSSDPLATLGRPDFATPKGEQKQVRLADGSLLTLDTDSAVDIAFSPTRRTMVLTRGRALFNVKSEPNRPFEVRAGDHRVVALGTEFDVRVDTGQVRVRLFEGRVAISSKKGVAPVQLQAGEEYLQQGASVRISAASPVEDALAWRHGRIIFENETLGAAAAEMNRYSARGLVVRDPGVAGLRISGAFNSGDPARFARTISSIHPVRVVKHSDGSIELLPSR